MDPALEALYGQRVRVRVCGICWKDESLLLINHQGLVEGGFWAPPGGGLEFGEPAAQRLRTEFVEETGLEISVQKFLFGCEFIHHPLHAIELFFEVAIQGGTLSKGKDPELNIISDVRFMKVHELAAIPESNRHGIFQLIPSAADLKTLTGFFTI